MAPQCRKIRQVEKFAGEIDQNWGRRERVQALGRHLLLELFDCDAEAINSLDTVKASMVEAAKRAQATIVDVVFHEFNPFGISGVVVIAESHLAIHTWPEYRYAAVDVFSCGDVLQPQVAADYLVEAFGADRASVVELQRGIFVNHGRPLLHKPAGASVATTPG
jgi:S-adenosylmethionine decarboxylase